MMRRRIRAGWAVLAACLAVAVAACTSAPLDDAGAPSTGDVPVGAEVGVEAPGPVITRTDAAPTGYQVTFTFAAPAGTTEVSLVGETYFTRPASLGGVETGFSHDARLGDDWAPGDIPHPLLTNAPAPLLLNRDSGLWEITTAMPAGTYSYGFVIGPCDTPLVCTATYDPANPPVLADVPGASSQSLSQVFVPTHPDFPTYDADYQGYPVAGTVSHLTFAEDGAPDPAGTLQVGVYLPPGYDAARAEPYPLLVISHGAGDNETAWFSQGSAASIVEEAIATGAIEPTVVVTTNFYNVDAGSTEPDTTLYDNYAEALRDVVLPAVEGAFHVSSDRADRAFGGLSMGGGIATHLLHHETDLFGYYGIWSGAKGALTDEERLDRANLETALGIHIGTGLQDYLAGIGEGSLARAESYREMGLPVVEHNVDGGHAWPVWRDMLHDFLHTVAFATVASDLAAGVGA